MNLLFLTLVFTFLNTVALFGQFINDTKTDSLVNLVSAESLGRYLKELSGDTTAVIGGTPFLIYSRYSLSPSNPKTAQYIFEKFQGFGLDVRYMHDDTNSMNVIARKTGVKYPNQKIVIGAHYDNIITYPQPCGPNDTVHGADDNASGVAAILEMARLVSGTDFDYTIEFAAWDNEEVPGIFGSRVYADSSYFRGDSILLYINIDMFAYNYQNSNTFTSGSDSICVFYNDVFRSVKSRFAPQFNLNNNVDVYSAGSDQLVFLNRNFRVYCFSENINMLNPYVHTISDVYSHLDLTYFSNVLKPVLGMLIILAGNKNAYFEHKPILYTSDTTSRSITAVIKMPVKFPVTVNAPRLYYKINSNSYSYVNAAYINGNYFRFTMPGAPVGSVVKYYFATQDSSGSFVSTYPFGGYGVNPPGSVPPANVFSYTVLNSLKSCSNTPEKPINDLQSTFDTIYIGNTGYVNKIRVKLTLNHTNDGDLIIQLLGPEGRVNLSQRNGNGGQNYINTVFDDTASVSIIQGNPPFTGNYKPQSPLSYFKDKHAEGYWVLRIFDAASGNNGSLVNWCIWMETKTSVGIEENIIPLKYSLSQNYPNPFNLVTNIKFDLPKSGMVSLKVYDMLGREVQTLVNEMKQAGNYKVDFEASNLTSGMYFYKLTAGEYTSIKKMVLIK